jgi:hypothetical protein
MFLIPDNLSDNDKSLFNGGGGLILDKSDCSYHARTHTSDTKNKTKWLTGSLLLLQAKPIKQIPWRDRRAFFTYL